MGPFRNASGDPYVTTIAVPGGASLTAADQRRALQMEGIHPETRARMEAMLAAMPGGMSVTLSSGYRDPATNAAVGGARGSAHLGGRAFDSTGFADDAARQAAITAALGAGFKGIGVYPDGSLHFDDKPDRQAPMFWGGDRAGRSVDQMPAFVQAAYADHQKRKQPMASLSFDDLIPAAAPQKAQPAALSFDDLIPAAPARSIDQAFAMFGAQPANAADPAQVRQAGQAQQERERVAREAMAARSGTPDESWPAYLGRKADAAVRGVADLATFGFSDEIAASLGALTGIGGTAGDYSGNLAQQRAVDRADEQASPYARLTGQLAGAFATAPIAGPINAPTLGGRMLQGARSGAVTGAAYGFGSGEGVPDRLSQAATGGLVGGLVGGAAPAVVEGVVRGAGAVGNAVAPTIRGMMNPEAEAARRVSAAIARDTSSGMGGLDDAAMRAALERGQPVANIDLGGETTRALARSAANINPEARAVIEATSERSATQNIRVPSFLEGMMGGALDNPAALDRLKIAARRANKPIYDAAYSHPGAQAVWDAGLEQLMQAPAMQQAARRAAVTGANDAALGGNRPVRNPFQWTENGYTLRKNADGSTAIPNLQFWDHVKRNLDDVIEGARRSGENFAAQQASEIKSALVARLDDATRLPTGESLYAKARGTAAQFFGASDALEAGAKFATTSQTPEGARKALAAMPEAERELFAQGFAGRVREIVRAAPDSRNVVAQIYGSPAAREKIAMAIGPKRAKELEAFLAVETTMDRVRLSLGNSTTARQLAELGLAGGAGLGAHFSGADLTTSAMIAGAIRLGRGAGNKVNMSLAKPIAEMLTATDPKVMERAIQRAASDRRVLEALTSVEDVISRLSSTASTEAAVGARPLSITVQGGAAAEPQQ